MDAKFKLGVTALWHKRPVTIVSRCFAGGEWLYGIRLSRGRIIDYIPERLLSEVV